MEAAQKYRVVLSHHPEADEREFEVGAETPQGALMAALISGDAEGCFADMTGMGENEGAVQEWHTHVSVELLDEGRPG